MPKLESSINCYNCPAMILVTGGTGFVGRALVNQLVEWGHPVRLLVRPSRSSPRLPVGVSVEVAVSSLADERSLRAAFRDVDHVFHLISDERRGLDADFTAVDVEGTSSLLQIAKQANIKRIFYLSHLGADQGSAFAMLRTKSIVENAILQSKIPYTIFRSAVIFGTGDHFTTSLVKLIKASPGFVLIPGEGDTLLQPIWVGDVVACLIWALDNTNAINQLYNIGGAEYLTFRQMLETIMSFTGRKRRLISLSPVYIRNITLWMNQFLRRYPISIHWLDYLGSDRICALDTLPRIFDIIPARFSHNLDYLEEI